MAATLGNQQNMTPKRTMVKLHRVQYHLLGKKKSEQKLPVELLRNYCNPQSILLMGDFNNRDL